MERILCLMRQYTLIAGRFQDAGDDKPFDGAAPNGRIRAEFKSMQGNVLDVKRDKPVKQFTSWNNSGRKFIPLQIGLDSLSLCWYMVLGIPWCESKVTLDPTITKFNPKQPLTPFRFGRCSLDELRNRERFEEMVIQLHAALKTIEENGDLINAAVAEEYHDYIAATAENTMEDANLMAAVYTRIGESKQAFANLAAHDSIIENMAQSPMVMGKLARSKEALTHLTNEIKNAPELLAKFLEMLGQSKPEESSS